MLSITTNRAWENATCSVHPAVLGGARAPRGVHKRKKAGGNMHTEAIGQHQLLKGAKFRKLRTTARRSVQLSCCWILCLRYGRAAREAPLTNQPLTTAGASASRRNNQRLAPMQGLRRCATPALPNPEPPLPTKAPNCASSPLFLHLNRCPGHELQKTWAKEFKKHGPRRRIVFAAVVFAGSAGAVQVLGLAINKRRGVS